MIAFGKKTRVNHNSRRCGFTMVELLIVVAIVGLLVSLSVPVVQHAREAGRRTHCINNLRSIGVALQVYHGSHQRLPPSMIWGPPGEPLGMSMVPIGVVDRVSFGLSPSKEPDRVYANWVVMLLPFVDEAALHKLFDDRVPLHDPRNEVARSTELAIMNCPSDSFQSKRNHFQRSPIADMGYARGNYAMNFGTNQNCLMRLSKRAEPIGGCKDGFQVDGNSLTLNTRQVWGSGVGGINHAVSYAQFSSGISKTVAIEEVRAGINSQDRRGVWALGFVGSSVTAGHGIHSDDCGPNNQNPDSDDIQGGIALAKSVGKGVLKQKRMPCSSRGNPNRELSLQATSRSEHPGGVNVMMADGSVHFAMDEISPEVWHQIHKRERQGLYDFPF